MSFIIVVLQILNPRFKNLSSVRVLQIWVQSAFYKFESSPRFTNLSPVRVLQVQSSPRFTTCLTWTTSLTTLMT